MIIQPNCLFLNQKPINKPTVGEKSMNIKVVRRYVSEDGTEHQTQGGAFKQNSLFKCYHGARIVHAKLGQNFVTNLVNSPELAKEMRDVCNKIVDHHRRYPVLH